AHDAGGLRFEVVEPFVEHRVTYDGNVCVLGRPKEMADPSKAFADNPHEPCTIDLRVTALGRPFGGEPEYEEGEEPDPHAASGFARGHTEQHMAVTGSVQVDGERFELADGLGLRDHSWGPRIWQSIWWYRWITASFGPLGLACTVRGEQDPAVRHVKGHLYDVERYGNEQWVPIRGMELASDYDDDLFPV